jgi:hypothetical protein
MKKLNIFSMALLFSAVKKNLTTYFKTDLKAKFSLEDY